MAKALKPQRTRKRSLPVNHKDLAQYLVECLETDLSDRSAWNEMRIQRYAKMRGWTEPKDFPWADASNAALTFLMTESTRSQDTLCNAILAKHPIVESRAIAKADMTKQKMIDEHLDYQLFVEQSGEEIVAQLVQSFVEDGVFLAYTPWVRYRERVTETRKYPRIPLDVEMSAGVMQAIITTLPPDSITRVEPRDDEGYRWRVRYREHDIEQMAEIEAYQDDDGDYLELCWKRFVVAYDGPCTMPKTVDEYVVPWRCENVQPPSPNNPNGADHVILLDYPSLDEVRRLHMEGYYDAMTAKELEDLINLSSYDPEQQAENADLQDLKDALEGIEGGSRNEGPEEVQGSKALTRMHCFLGWDVDGDGLQEQIVVTMLKENKQIVRVRSLTEDYPSDPPRRPLAYAAYLPVAGRFYGISLLEVLEAVHDRMKMNYDQGTDAATIKNVPWFTYKPSSATPPRTIHIAPGEGVPMANPRDDIFVPQFASQGDAWMMNMMALLQQEAERASMQGAVQFGQIPRGKSSALRTSSNMQAVMSQGDARPERLLRRFFGGFREVYAMMHELNQRFLPKKKQITLMEPAPDGTQIYQDVLVEQVSGKMRFTFTAGMFNTNKEMQIQILQTLMGILINPLMLQIGVVGQEQIFNLLTDFIKIMQQPNTRYIKQPQPGPEQIFLTADEVMQMLVSGRMPTDQVMPKEGFEAHAKRIQEILSLPELEGISAHVHGWVNAYLTRMQEKQAQAIQQQQILQAAQQFQQQINSGQGQPGPQPQGGPPNVGTAGNQQLSDGEMLDETMQGG